MSLRHALALAVAVGLVSSSAAAQDDLVAPLAPPKAKAKKKKKPDKPAPRAKEEAPQGHVVISLQAPSKGAVLLIDGVEVGPVSTAPHAVAPGDHSITVKRLGYADFTKKVSVPQGGTAKLDVSLEAVAGVVSIQSDVANANVFVDGEPYGQTPLRDLLLLPGPHEILVKKDGFQEETSKLVVKAGKEDHVRLSLKPVEVVAAAPPPPAKPPPNENPLLDPPDALTPKGEGLTSTSAFSPVGTEKTLDGRPWYGQWYVWAGGAAVAAGVTTGLVLNSYFQYKQWCEQLCAGGTCPEVELNGKYAEGCRKTIGVMVKQAF
jgi:hypothetical protein